MAIPTERLQDDILKMFLQGIDPSWRTNANLYISLHTANPGDAGDQTTNEATFTGYARVAILHDGVGWHLVGHTMKNFVAVTFPACTAGTNTITHIGVGTASTGAGILLAKNVLTASLAVSPGITVNFAVDTINFTTS